MDRKKREKSRFIKILIHLLVISIVLVILFIFLKFFILKKGHFPFLFKEKKVTQQNENKEQKPVQEFGEYESGSINYIEKIGLLKAIIVSLENVEVDVKEQVIISKSTSQENLFNMDIKLFQDNGDLTLINVIITSVIEKFSGKILERNEDKMGDKQQLKVLDSENIIFISISYFPNIKKGDIKKKKVPIAVLVDDFGYNSGELLKNFLEADKRIAFAIIPYLPHSKTVMDKAVEYGHEVFIHAPMEPDDYPKYDPGDKAIFVDLSRSEIRNRMNGYIKELPKAIGLNNHMGSRATSDKRVMRDVLEVVKENNLLFVDSKTIASSIATDIANQINLPNISRDIFLDSPNPSRETIENHLVNLKLSKKNKILVITHASSQERLTDLLYFLKETEKIGYKFVAVSELFNLKTAY